MTVISYYSTLIGKNQPSSQEAADTTSSQIVLSRGVARPDYELPPHDDQRVSVTSVYESAHRRIMALGDGANSTPSLVDGADAGRKSSTISNTSAVGGSRAHRNPSVFSIGSNYSAGSSRQPSSPSALSTLSIRTEALNAARAARQIIPQEIRAPEDLRANARSARQVETEIREVQTRKGGDILSFINDVETTYLQRSAKPERSYQQIPSKSNASDDLLELINKIDLSHIKEKLRRSSSRLSDRRKSARPSTPSSTEPLPIIPGDVMDFIIKVEVTHAQSSIANPTSTNEPTPQFADQSASSKLGVEQEHHLAITDLDLTTKLEAAIRPLDKGKGKEVDYGPTLERKPVFPNPFAKSESKVHEQKTTIDVDVDQIQSRPASLRRASPRGPSIDFGSLQRRSTNRSSTVFEDPLDPLAALEDSLLEPCPAMDARKSVGEILEEPFATSDIAAGRTRTSTFSSSFSSKSFNQASTLRTPTEPKPTLSEVLENVSTTPSSFGTRLPTEILHQIFSHLTPSDFNAARHTCRSWFINSLERSILECMLKRGGWSNNIPQPLAQDQPAKSNIEDNQEWLMSKKISRECALGPDWTGNGLPKTLDNIGQTPVDSPFADASRVDFTETAVHYPSLDCAGIAFTVSSCGKYLMNADGCLISIYELNRSHHGGADSTSSSPGYLRPIASIICPRRVLACSMDTSSHRYAVAALLDGRMGIVCEISPDNIPRPITAHSSSRDHKKQWTCGKDMDFHIHDEQSCSSSINPSFLDQASLNSGVPELDGAEASSLERPSPSKAFTSEYESQTRRQSLITPQNQKKQERISGMPIEIGPRSIYRDVCSEDDPPRSVAICPQRRCVAFGCSTGIELHWVDALTGQDLKRWFPLTAPSDYLFFLPPRMSIDSAKKLRLISSAGRPSQTSAMFRRTFTSQIMNGPFWGHSAFNYNVGSSRSGLLSRLRGHDGTRSRSPDHSDHYRAIPLSDGYHIVFTDPSTGMLCLGSDAPVGGPTKLLRKLWFAGPEGKGSPLVYASGANLKSGVRVVAAYGTGAQQSVWLFSVPADIFAASQASAAVVGSSWLRASQQNRRNVDWMSWWPDDGLQEWLNHAGDPIGGILPTRSVWPVKIRGQEVANCEDITDLAIDSGPDMSIWAFCRGGIAKVWKIDDGKRSSARSFDALRDGTIRETD